MWSDDATDQTEPASDLLIVGSAFSTKSRIGKRSYSALHNARQADSCDQPNFTSAKMPTQQYWVSQYSLREDSGARRALHKLTGLYCVLRYVGMLVKMTLVLLVSEISSLQAVALDIILGNYQSSC